MKRQLIDVKDEVERLKGIITESIPFIGYEAHVPDIVKKAEDAVDYGASLPSAEVRSERAVPRTDEPWLCLGQ